MNWDAIAAIAELLGAVGVIASLVYLARQIRQSTRAVQGSTYQGLIGVQRQFQGGLTYDAEMAEIFRRGREDISQLSEAEVFRFGWFLGGTFNNYENAMYQFESKMLAPDRWQVQVANLRGLLASQGIRTWWHTIPKKGMAPEFVALVDEILAEQRGTE